jgi:hypothetical protein
MPSSSEPVATTALSWPALSCASISWRRSRDTEPWCEQGERLPALSLIMPVTRSATRRLWQKTSTERWPR